MISFLFYSLALISGIHSAANNEPPDGKLYIAAWLQTNDSAPNAGDGDRPARANARVRFNFSAFQFGQDLPVLPGDFPFPDDQIYATNTDAIIMLTIYSKNGPWDVPEADLKALEDQMVRLTTRANRRVLLRYLPEFNGNWNPWGQQPTLFIPQWRAIYTRIKSAAPLVDFVWAPSSGNGYPFLPFQGTAADLALLDTNRNGRLDAGDDPYSPYYPGDAYVDWVGMSIYSYGSSYPWSDNIVAPAGRFESILNTANFYQTYAVQKNLPFMVAETASTFHLNTPLGPGVGDLAVKQSWWRQFITNPSLLARYPKMKLICLFEWKKIEETFANGVDSFRDFTITNSTQVLNAFLQDFSAVTSNYLFANSTTAGALPSPPPAQFTAPATPVRNPEVSQRSSDEEFSATGRNPGDQSNGEFSNRINWEMIIILGLSCFYVLFY